jgi:hypothetical protein
MAAIFTFDSTHHALWAEQIAMERGLGAQVVPAPPESNAKCDLALEVLEDDAEPLMAALLDAGVEFARFDREA